MSDHPRPPVTGSGGDVWLTVAVSAADATVALQRLMTHLNDMAPGPHDVDDGVEDWDSWDDAQTVRFREGTP